MISLNADLQKKLAGGMDDELGVRLPFPTPLLFALNGDGVYKNLLNAQYYGGWGVDAQQMEDAIDEAGKDRIFPTSFMETTGTNGNGDDYRLYCTRFVIVAPISRRFSWVQQVGKAAIRSMSYFDGARMHVQVLAYLAQKDAESKKVIPWGPVILSAKGYQAGYIMEAFKTWKKASAGARKQFANDLDANLFYAVVGTFGTERIAEKKGTKKTSQITPLKPFIPEKVTEEILVKYFVGEQVAAIMADLKEQAIPWRDAWREAAVETKPNSGNGHNGFETTAPRADEDGLQPPDQDGEEEPF